MKVVVIGGGFIGQLVQFAVPNAKVLDWRKEAPINHLETRMGPQYLWEPIPDCDSESFEVTTLVDGLPPAPESILAYKRKIGKENDGGDWGLQFQHKMTGWSSRLPVPRIEYNQTVRMVDLVSHQLGMADWTVIDFDVLVSTIPLPAFLDLLIVGPEYRSAFKHDPIYMAQLPAAVPMPPAPGMTLNYISLDSTSIYRETLHEGVVFQESLLPIPGSRRLLPGKIHPHPENETILAALGTYDCYCFGRFAAWRPDELAHQTWRDIASWKETLGL